MNQRDTQAGLGWLAAAYAAFTLYGSLLPWRWTVLPWSMAQDRYLGLRGGMLPLSWPDAATNVALYAVLSALWCGNLGLRRREDMPWPGLAGGVLVVLGCSLLSAGIEFAQLFFPPRTSSAYDWLSNTLGGVVGVFFWRVAGLPLVAAVRRWRQRVAPSPALPPVSRRVLTCLVVPYLLALTAANHWWSAPWISWTAVADRLPALSLLPFDKHQQATTGLALASVAWQFLLYMPLGMAMRAGWPAVSPRASALFALGLAGVLETGRLFIAGQWPDTGNVAVAICAVWLGAAAWPVWQAWRNHARRAVDATMGSVGHAAPAQWARSGQAAHAQALMLRLTAVVLAGVVVGTLAQFPVQPGLLAAGALAYVLVLLRWPSAWLLVLPAALAVLDLAPLSGWFMVDEFDLLLLLTLAVGVWQLAARPAVAVPPLPSRLGWALLGVSLLVSGLLGAWPLPPLDANALASYFSRFNSLRVAKGFAEACALVALLRTMPLSTDQAQRQLGLGIVLGLTGVTVLSIWERWAYPGLLDFNSEHRVGSSFSSMHNGGSHIEAFLATAVPFLLAACWSTRRLALRLLGAALFLASTYALMVTYARGGYVAYTLACLMSVALLLRQEPSRGGLPRTALALAGVALVAALSVSAVVLSGSFAQQRLANSATDLGIRHQHWRSALDLMPGDAKSVLLGMGLGRFPETYFYGQPAEQRAATFRYQAGADGPSVALGHGKTMYLEQFVQVAAKQPYQLSLELRARGRPTTLNVLLCARTYFSSYGCASATLVADGAVDRWVTQRSTLDSAQLGGGPWWARRPVKLSLENAGAGSVAEVRNIRLQGPDGQNLVKNGDFAQGRDHWFFSSNFNHLPWHIKSLPVALYFDQGVLGVLALSVLLLSSLAAMAGAAWRGNAWSAAGLAATLGFLCVGLFDSLFDAPRLSCLLLLILAICRPGLLPASAAVITAPTNPPASTTQRSWSAAAHDIPPPWRTAIGRTAAGVVLGALFLAVLTRTPGVPHNLRDLPNPLHPLLAPIGLSLAAWWVLGMPVVLARWLQTSPTMRWLMPLALAVHAVLGWLILRESTLPAMMHKVTGYPVLSWPWEWETLARYVALQSAMVLGLLGGCLVWRRAANTGVLAWGLWALGIGPLLYQAVVQWAATDNLVELMADDAAPWAFLCLMLWFLLVGAVGHGLLDRRRPLGLRLLLLMLSLPAGYGLLFLGLNSAVDKYGMQFSGLQFLLSAGRQDYAQGLALGLRYVVAHLGVLGLLALAQWPWQGGPGGGRPPQSATLA